MRAIGDTPNDQRFLMVTHRLSPARWENECRAVRDWLTNPPDTISKSDADEMLASIAEPLPKTHHAFVVFHCYADIPARTRWDTAFDPSVADRHESTIATLQFGVFWRRAVLSALEHGHHQIAVLKFPDGLPDLLDSLPVDPDNEVSDYAGLCASDDLPAIRRQLDNVS
jgi:hypothetical protein